MLCKGDSSGGGSPLTRHHSGPLAVIMVLIVLCLAVIGVIAPVSFLWNRRAVMSRGLYSSLTSSDNLDGIEMERLTSQDPEAEK